VATTSRERAAIKFLFWTIASLAMIAYVFHSYRSGQMIRWYYYTADMDGYAVNADSFKDATGENPAVLAITDSDRIDGLMAVRVKKGERLPEHCNGIISKKALEEGKRVALEGDTIKVMVPWEIKESKGFKYKDSFKHKGIKTNPWSGAWNVAVVIALGICLGFMAEGFTDMLGWRIHKLHHFEGH